MAVEFKNYARCPKRSNGIYKYGSKFIFSSNLANIFFLELSFNHSLFSFHFGAILNDLDFHGGGDDLSGAPCNGLLCLCVFGAFRFPIIRNFPSLLVVGARKAT